MTRYTIWTAPSATTESTCFTRQLPYLSRASSISYREPTPGSSTSAIHTGPPDAFMMEDRLANVRSGGTGSTSMTGSNLVSSWTGWAGTGSCPDGTGGSSSVRTAS